MTTATPPDETRAASPPADDRYTFVDSAVGGVAKRNHVQDLRTWTPTTQAFDSYITWMRFPEAFRDHTVNHPSGKPSVSGYTGDGLALFVPIDIDVKGDRAEALSRAQAVLRSLENRALDINLGAVRCYFSGDKGFSLEIPATLFGGFAPGPCREVAALIRAIALQIAADAGVTIDTAIYDPTRLWRVPNSRHSTSGLCKIPLTAAEVLDLSIEAIEHLAKEPRLELFAPDEEWTPVPALIQLKQRAAQNDTTTPVQEPIDIKKLVLDGVPEGKRDETLWRAACKMRGLDVPEAIAWDLIRRSAAACTPPFPEAVALEKVTRAYTKYEPDEPYPEIVWIDDPKPQAQDGQPAQDSVGAAEEPAKPAAVPEAQLVRRFTDTGNAERLVDMHGADLRYSHLWDKWLVWDGRRWQMDAAGAIDQRAKKTARRIYRETELADNKQQVAQVVAWARKSEERGRLASMIALARSEPSIPITPAELDADPWAFNCANGTIDLRTGERRPHNRADLCTKLAPVEYEPTAACPQWLAFLDTIMRGDTDMIAFLQRAFGYSLTGFTTEQVIFILFGLGANGKSTLIETLRAMLGDYGQQADFTTFLARDRDSVRNDLARLVGARFVAAVEADAGGRLSEVVVKSISGGDTITTRFLFKEFFEFVPQFKLFLATNHKPEVKGTDEAIWRRLRLVPFEVTIPEEKRDRALPATLRAELPGILAWAVRGCLEWQRIGLGVPAAVREATAEYRAEQDVLDGFLTERCIIAPSATITASALYADYREFAKSAGEDPLTQTKFGRLLISDPAGRFKPSRTKTGRYWQGIALRPTTSSTDDRDG